MDMINYNRGFIENLSVLAKLLNNLLKKNKNFYQTEAQENEFNI